jgi:hypothetical protein
VGEGFRQTPAGKRVVKKQLRGRLVLIVTDASKIPIFYERAILRTVPFP